MSSPKFAIRCFTSQMQKEKYSMTLLILLLITIIGLISSIAFLNSEEISWNIIDSKGTFSLILLIISIIGMILTLFTIYNASFNIKMCDNNTLPSLCFTDTMQRKNYVLLSIIIMILSIPFFFLSLLQLNDINWVIPNNIFAFVIFILSLCVFIFSIISIYRGATQIKDCEK